jgi:hypothetical protein
MQEELLYEFLILPVSIINPSLKINPFLYCLMRIRKEEIIILVPATYNS